MTEEKGRIVSSLSPYDNRDVATRKYHDNDMTRPVNGQETCLQQGLGDGKVSCQDDSLKGQLLYGLDRINGNGSFINFAAYLSASNPNIFVDSARRISLPFSEYDTDEKAVVDAYHHQVISRLISNLILKDPTTPDQRLRTAEPCILGAEDVATLIRHCTTLGLKAEILARLTISAKNDHPFPISLLVLLERMCRSADIRSPRPDVEILEKYCHFAQSILETCVTRHIGVKPHQAAPDWACKNRGCGCSASYSRGPLRDAKDGFVR